jgi:LysM repeat protein
MSTSDTLAAGPGISRLGKKDMEPEIDFRKGLVGDESEFFEPDVRIGKPVEPDAADTDAFMSAVDSYGEQNPYMQSWGGKYATGGSSQPQWRYVEKGEDPARYGSDTISGTGTPDWRSIAAAGKPAAASGLPKMRFDRASNSLVPVDAPPALDLSPKTKDKLDRQTRSVNPADGSGANPNIDAATRDRARAWAAQQNVPVDTAKKKADWKTIYNLNKSIIGDNPNLIKPGMKLKMPDGSTYRVQPGDNLSKIAAGQINELSTNKLAQYKTAAAKDAKEADKAGDFERGNKRFHGIVQATKKQFDNDAKKVDESRAARRALMARIVNGG